MDFVYAYNPSVSAADSSLYTRAPVPSRNLLMPPLCKGRWLVLQDGGVVPSSLLTAPVILNEAIA